MKEAEPQEPHEFLIPDYYNDFSCKMGNCRSACCVGWPISISMQNYFHLLGINCPKHLRDRLDCGMRVVNHPTEDEYAVFEPKYDGNCPLRMPDGRCSLHAELGENILPDVCRLYPRGIRAENDLYECSCANSCEATLELLFDKTSPISFVHSPLKIKMPPLPERHSFFETLGESQKIRLHLISLIQNRSVPLPGRIIALGKTLDLMDAAFKNKDRSALTSIFDTPFEDIVPKPPKNIDVNILKMGITIVSELVAILDKRSDSIRSCGEAALKYFGNDENSLDKYFAAKARFDETFENHEIFYEHMLVNHMFFSQFPFQDRPESMHSEFVALCAVYAILRFLGIGSTADKCDKNTLIDGMAATFRLVDHTEFDRYASHILKKLDCTSTEKLYSLLAL